MTPVPVREVTSTFKIVLYSFLAGFSVLIVTTVLQWLVYDDWLNRGGPLRLLGTSVAAMITFWSVLRWQLGVRERHRELLRRFEVIATMTDRVRNELQAIECLTYAADHSLTDSVRTAVETIEATLRDVVSETRAAALTDSRKKMAASVGAASHEVQTPSSPQGR
ncbi:MAG TPA: hypothetical protein VE994_16475 [Terriglobales bacterium]|nr:hypothetical protein [Terriglobales bacterium]